NQKSKWTSARSSRSSSAVRRPVHPPHTCGSEALLAVSWFIVFSKKKIRRRIRRGFPCDNLAGSLISFSTNVIRTRCSQAVLNECGCILKESERQTRLVLN